MPKFKADFISSDEDFASAKRFLVAECNKFVVNRPTMTAETEPNERQDGLFRLHHEDLQDLIPLKVK